jgi:hypothetical protein
VGSRNSLNAIDGKSGLKEISDSHAVQSAHVDEHLGARDFWSIKGAHPRQSIVSLALIVGGLIWFGACVVGFKMLFDYGQTPGAGASVPVGWPADSTLPVKANQTTLIMFVHPHCPCSRASIGELARLMAHSSKHLDAYVLFWQPKGYPLTWAKSELWQSAAAIPGVECVLDPDGKEACRFHAATSGQVAIYSSAGHLLFSGGITPSRGHFGDSIGLDSALASVSTTTAKPCSAVFGCPLFGPTLGRDK